MDDLKFEDFCLLQKNRDVGSWTVSLSVRVT